MDITIMVPAFFLGLKTDSKIKLKRNYRKPRKKVR
jgi:hypothetical protein